MNCRHCNAPLTHTFLNLGYAPPSNAYLSTEDLAMPEMYYPLNIKVCDHCWLVQTEDYAQADDFFGSDYAYFSSTSSSWLAHARDYSEKISKRLGLNGNSLVIEVASNDGYLLKNFIEFGIPCLGIEPTDSTAKAAERLGIPVLRKFFGESVGEVLATEGRQADLIVGNNVYAHVPDINDFTRGLKAVLKPGGTITLEFPHLMRLIEQTQFDTVYHEHFSYLSLHTVTQIFDKAGLLIWNVEELQTHGGSLRVYGCHAADSRVVDSSVSKVLLEEKNRGLQQLETYLSFQARADKAKNDLLTFLIEQKKANKKVVAYGAAAKGNTLLNYAGVKPDLLSLVFDAAVAKQNKYMPGSHIPILSPDQLNQAQPDYVLILPWNIALEVREQISDSVGAEVKFVIAVPSIVEL
jgi:hypothetical protein